MIIPKIKRATKIAGATPQRTTKEIISRILTDLLGMDQQPKIGSDYITFPLGMSAKTEGENLM
jgi:hypothetical protein